MTAQAGNDNKTIDPSLAALYGQLCESYRAIDSFRMSLLGLLPLASAGGVLFLFQKEEFTARQLSLLPPIGAFAFAITLGLLLFEIYGIRKCHALILAGRDLEGRMGTHGQFICRPRAVGGQINEPFASGVIYPAVLAAWAYVGLRSVWPSTVGWVALGVFATGFGLMLAYNIHLGARAPALDCQEVGGDQWSQPRLSQTRVMEE